MRSHRLRDKRVQAPQGAFVSSFACSHHAVFSGLELADRDMLAGARHVPSAERRSSAGRNIHAGTCLHSLNSNAWPLAHPCLRDLGGVIYCMVRLLTNHHDVCLCRADYLPRCPARCARELEDYMHRPAWAWSPDCRVLSSRTRVLSLPRPAYAAHDVWRAWPNPSGRPQACGTIWSAADSTMLLSDTIPARQ